MDSSVMSSPSSLLVLTLEEACDLIVDAERSLSSHLQPTLETIQRGTHESIRRLHGLLTALIDNASTPLGVSVAANVLMLWMSAGLLREVRCIRAATESAAKSAQAAAEAAQGAQVAASNVQVSLCCIQ
ncbi:unnamed protein product [Vitrella brassicaformis CCMP3155]|uniref:Uncharacterized protein n=1 Tax=Vitrella brassicaformis (strain CCMP3155) TaxID=1169540 RepID=A0A0G4EP62_VITBC|nr:unnamed protein product [Vitrella brassicaformis CCMP3155]|eukprot:CEL99241.1 unnamed protein product [Vitrella brassicaformis CCMP3155]